MDKKTERGERLNFAAQAKRLQADIVRDRRYFHRHPELSFQEKETSAYIGARLKEMGLTPHTFEDYYGLYADVGRGERMILLRADIDALPVCEKTGADYASQNEGVMHACGHDAHAAMLLGAARLLADHADQLGGRVRLLFESAEESCYGARYYVEQGIADGALAVFGQHVWGDLNAPGINIEAGQRMTSCDNFTIKVSGKSAHASAPNDGVDAIVAAAGLITAIQTIVSRKNDPRNSLAISIGEIHGGQRFNIIADTVVMKGTVRTHSPETRARVEGWLREVVESTASVYGAAGELEYEYFPSPVINDEHYTHLAQKAAVSLFGPDCLLPMEKTMLSEDFSYYEQKAPGVFAFIGARNEKTGMVYKNHNERFEADEEGLWRGAALYAQFAYDCLNEKDRS